MSDNYGVLLHHPEHNETVNIDTGDAAATLQHLEQTGWTLTEQWVTHHHADHTAGVVDLKTATNALTIGPSQLSKPIAGLDKTVTDGDTLQFAGLPVQIIHTPGHTKDMMNYYLPTENLLFTGDTLFTLGCGRLFEADAVTMHKSLSKLAALPANTIVYSSHEYTIANAKFALSVDPNNQALIERMKEFESLRADGKPTVPTTIAQELQTNPFLRANDAGIRKLLNMQNAPDSDVFAEIRKRKDEF
jgi:hydroxyacylglutathione hydrolase